MHKLELEDISLVGELPYKWDQLTNKTILISGGTGFIGRNVLPILKTRFEIFAPKRSELNLFKSDEVSQYIKENKIDVVMHCANPNPSKNKLDSDERMIRDSLELFLSIYRCRDLVEKIVYLGSGAVYDKSKDIVLVHEEGAYASFPKDDYGFAKYVMNSMTCGNVYNLCVFGCYGPGDADSKFITHCIHCCLQDEPITIRQDCMFDYMQVTDLGEIMTWIIDNTPKHNMYNACTGERHSLLEIAHIVKRKMNSSKEIVILKDGWNNEYTGSNERLMAEFSHSFISLENGIDIQIEWEKRNFDRSELNDFKGC